MRLVCITVMDALMPGKLTAGSDRPRSAMLSRMVIWLVLGWASGPPGNWMEAGKTVISGTMVAKAGMMRGFLLVGEDFREISPWTTVMLRVAGRWAGAAAVTAN